MQLNKNKLQVLLYFNNTGLLSVLLLSVFCVLFLNHEIQTINYVQVPKNIIVFVLFYLLYKSKTTNFLSIVYFLSRYI